jgi:hypothetical protein
MAELKNLVRNNAQAIARIESKLDSAAPAAIPVADELPPDDEPPDDEPPASRLRDCDRCGRPVALEVLSANDGLCSDCAAVPEEPRGFFPNLFTRKSRKDK